MNIWKILGIEPTIDKKAIRRAYAERTREVHPEEKPEEFKQLHEAYQAALGYADFISKGHLPDGGIIIMGKDVEKTGGNAAACAGEEDGEEKTARAGEEDGEDRAAQADGKNGEDDAPDTEAGRQEETLRSYFEDTQERRRKRIDAFMAHWREMKNPYQNPEMMDWWKEYLYSEEFQDIRSHSQVVRLLAEEIDDKFFYGINELKLLFWDAYGFQEGEETTHQGDMRQLYRCLYPAYEKRRSQLQYEQKWARNDKMAKIFIGIAAAVVLVICIVIPISIHRQRENGRLFLIAYMAEQYPAVAFSEPERTEKTENSGGIYNMRVLAHPELSVTAMVEYQYVEGEKAYLVTEDYSQQIFEFYAAQYGLEAGRADYTEESSDVDRQVSVLYVDMEEVDDFCERAERMFAEQEELQAVPEVIVFTENVLFPEILVLGGVSGFPFADMQMYDFRNVKASELSAKLREAYMIYMFQYEPWNMTTAQYREWGAAYEKICEEWEDEDGEWHEVYDPDTGEYLCRLFINTYQTYDGYYSATGNIPSMPILTRKITVGNAYYFLQDREADLRVNGDGSGFEVEFYGTDTQFGEDPEVKFNDLRNYY